MRTLNRRPQRRRLRALLFVGVGMRTNDKLQSMKSRLLEIRVEAEALGHELLSYFIDMSILEIEKQEKETPDDQGVNGYAEPRAALKACSS